MSVARKPWTKAQRKRLSISMKAAIANRKEEALKLKTLKSLADEANSLQQAKDVEVAMTPSADIEHIREYSYRRGLVTAMECILRELR